jgi:hypothetical protein
MTTDSAIVKAVQEVYNHIDSLVLTWRQSAGDTAGVSCSACGKCCDFATFGHRLFVYSPEVVYLCTKLGTGNITSVADGRCPWNTTGRCGIYPYRFSGCRIFFCRGDAIRQAELSERVSAEFKAICSVLGLAYRYADLGCSLSTVIQPDLPT